MPNTFLNVVRISLDDREQEKKRREGERALGRYSCIIYSRTEDINPERTRGQQSEHMEDHVESSSPEAKDNEHACLLLRILRTSSRILRAFLDTFKIEFDMLSVRRKAGECSVI
ncbi:hypothetical protein K0M31_014564 [Melipona bicolor]|uniref:Uncharacterized protein n=1 Tax=Melipona bicolor TaxID=60889 RepID=A0AA40G927_9HYME|nr:hypothetical protein K0M31_014564 [Melipona bicolor]